MAKNILIFSDGTGQAGGVRPDQRLSNIYKLYRATRTGPDSPIDPAAQVTFYDAGLGTDDDVGTPLLSALRFLRKLLASATGRGVTRNITDCYEAIINAYEPGDRIYLFGFSRGAYTVRSVAGLLALCGIPTKGRDGLAMPKSRSETRAIADEAVRRVYEHGAGKPPADYEAEREEQARRFRLKYASDTEGHSNVNPYFIGVFDTVASLGAKGIVRVLLWSTLVAGALGLCAALAWLIELTTGLAFLQALVAFVVVAVGLFLVSTIRATLKYITKFPEGTRVSWHIAKWSMKNYNRGLSQRVSFARHALAIDETRSDFPRVQWGFRKDARNPVAGEPEFLRQIWFAGNHSDIGGSYREEESRLSDIALGWMVEQLNELPHPILIDATKLNLFPDPAGPQHCEIDARRDSWPGWVPDKLRMTWPEKLRTEALGAPVHSSVDVRFALGNVLKCGRPGPYRPATLRKDPRFEHYYD